MASRASEKMNNSPCSSRCWPSGHAAGKRPLLHGIFFLLFSNPPGLYKPPAVPSGAAPGAHYPAGPREDIQAVTEKEKMNKFPQFKLFPGPPARELAEVLGTVGLKPRGGFKGTRNPGITVLSEVGADGGVA